MPSCEEICICFFHHLFSILCRVLFYFFHVIDFEVDGLSELRCERGEYDKMYSSATRARETERTKRSLHNTVDMMLLCRFAVKSHDVVGTMRRICCLRCLSVHRSTEGNGIVE